MNTKIQVGSKAFFSQYEDFEPTDNDFVEIHDVADTDFWVSNENDEHIFNFRRMNKLEFISFEANRAQKFPLVISKFIVPELIEHFGINLEDLFICISIFNNIDRKHLYVKYIFECYLKNGNFTLTEEQRDEAYRIYKEVR